MKSIETPNEYMESLDWNYEILQESKAFLLEWDKTDDSYYKSFPKYIKETDLAEREHYRNCVNYWEKKLNENKSS